MRRCSSASSAATALTTSTITDGADRAARHRHDRSASRCRRSCSCRSCAAPASAGGRASTSATPGSAAPGRSRSGRSSTSRRARSRSSSSSGSPPRANTLGERRRRRTSASRRTSGEPGLPAPAVGHHAVGRHRDAARAERARDRRRSCAGSPATCSRACGSRSSASSRRPPRCSCSRRSMCLVLFGYGETDDGRRPRDRPRHAVLRPRPDPVHRVLRPDPRLLRARGHQDAGAGQPRAQRRSTSCSRSCFFALASDAHKVQALAATYLPTYAFAAVARLVPAAPPDRRPARATRRCAPAVRLLVAVAARRRC